MRRAFLSLAAILSLACFSRPCVAQFGGGGLGGQGIAGQGMTGMGMLRPAVTTFGVETTEGNVVVGTIAEISLKVETDELGTLELAQNALQSLVFSDEDGPDILRTVQGSTIKGKVILESVKLQSEFGPMTIERSKIRSIESHSVSFGPGMMGGPGMQGMMMGAQPAPATNAAPRAAGEAKKAGEPAVPKEK